MLWKGTLCLCQMSCCREEPAEQTSNERMPVGHMLPVFFAFLHTSLCFSCRWTETTGQLTVSGSPARPCPSGAGGAEKRSIPLLPGLEHK